MKASELIEKLQSLIEKYGDVELFIQKESEEILPGIFFSTKRKTQAPEAELKEFTDQDLKSYLENMYKTSVNDISRGYNTIANNINMPVETARSIRKYLERKNIIETTGTKTKIIDFDYYGGQKDE